METQITAYNFDFYYRFCLSLGSLLLQGEGRIKKDYIAEVIRDNPNDILIPSTAQLDDRKLLIQHTKFLRAQLHSYLRKKNAQKHEPTLVEILIRQDHQQTAETMMIKDDLLRCDFSAENLAQLNADPGLVRFIERKYDLPETGKPHILLHNYIRFHDTYQSIIKHKLTKAYYLLGKEGELCLINSLVPAIEPENKISLCYHVLSGLAARGDLELFRSFREQMEVEEAFDRQDDWTDAYTCNLQCLSEAALHGHTDIIDYLRGRVPNVADAGIIGELLRGGHKDKAFEIYDRSPKTDRLKLSLVQGLINYGDITLLETHYDSLELKDLTLICDRRRPNRDMFYYIILRNMTNFKFERSCGSDLLKCREFVSYCQTYGNQKRLDTLYNHLYLDGELELIEFIMPHMTEATLKASLSLRHGSHVDIMASTVRNYLDSRTTVAKLEV